MGKHRSLVAGVVAGLVLAGCSAADDPARPPAVVAHPSPAPGSVSCAHDLGGAAPDTRDYRVVLDAVALPARTLEPQGSGEPGWLFAKQGLLVRAGAGVEISVAPEWATAARIGWGSPGPEGTAISVPACRGGPSGWLAFPGGYTVREPACVPLLVRVDGREEAAAVSVGVPC